MGQTKQLEIAINESQEEEGVRDVIAVEAVE